MTAEPASPAAPSVARKIVFLNLGRYSVDLSSGLVQVRVRRHGRMNHWRTVASPNLRERLLADAAEKAAPPTGPVELGEQPNTDRIK